MVVKVFADAGPVGHDINAELFQMRGGADARQQQQLRRADGARTQDDFAARARNFWPVILPILNSRCTSPVKQDALAHDAGFELQVRTRQRGLQECARRAHAQAALLRDFTAAHAFRFAGVEIAA
jgi:hypothetical protein